jgi:hypothetical protein
MNTYKTYETFKAAWIALQLAIISTEVNLLANMKQAAWMVQTYPEWADQASESL